MTSDPKIMAIGRRGFLRGAAGLAGAALIAKPAIVRAQAKGRVVVGTWGGDYARLLNKNIEQPFLILLSIRAHKWTLLRLGRCGITVE